MDELRKLSELIGRIYDASVDPAILPEVVERTAAWLDAPMGLLLTPFHPPSSGGYAVPAGIDQAGMELWATRYQAHDVWAQRCLAAGLVYEGNVACGHEYLPQEELYDSLIYREHLSRYDIAQVLSGIVFDHNSPLAITTGLAVYRGRNAALFGETEKRKLGLLIPHFSRALGVMLRLRDAEFRVANSLAALDRIHSGILLFGTGGAVTFANAAARRLIGEADGLTLVQAGVAQRLTCFDAATNAKLNDALSAALDRSRVEVPHFCRSVAVPRRSNAIPLSVQFSALPAANEFGQGSMAPQAIAFIADAGAPLRIDAGLLRQTFELTPAEARAAVALCDGGNVEETAAALGVAASTLKTQLSSIYQKTHVDSRAKLVRLVLALAGASAAKAGGSIDKPS